MQRSRDEKGMGQRRRWVVKVLHSSFGSGWNAFFLKYVSIDRLYTKKVFMTIKHLLGPRFTFRMGLGAHRVQSEMSFRLRSVPARSRVAMGRKRTKCVLRIHQLCFLPPSSQCIPGLGWCLLISLRPGRTLTRRELALPQAAAGSVHTF